MKFRFVSNGQVVTDSAIVSQTLRGNSLRPLPPYNFRVTRDAGDNMFLEWSRRSRLAGGLRPRTDVPVAEENESFQLETYSGSTLVSTYYINAPAAVTPFLLDRTNTTAGVPDSNGARFVTEQALDPEKSWVEGTIDMGALQQSVGLVDGTMTSTVDGDDVTWSSDLIVSATMDSVNGLSVVEAGVTKYTQGVAYADPFARVRVALIDNRIHYYLNPTGTDDVPLFVSSRTDMIGLNIHGYFFDADGTITNRKFRRKLAYFLYTADQQTDDGFTPGVPIKFRLYQVSAVVGRGAYVEATL